MVLIYLDAREDIDACIDMEWHVSESGRPWSDACRRRRTSLNMDTMLRDDGHARRTFLLRRDF